MRLALDGIPVYPRPILITRSELAREMVNVMGDRSVCLLLGHGITVAAESVEHATVLAVNLNELLAITVDIARLGARPPALSQRDVNELPDLGQSFNVGKAWQALVAGFDGART